MARSSSSPKVLPETIPAGPDGSIPQEAANEPDALDHEAFEERAAIREYDGGYSRDDAELLAAWEVTQALFARLTAREWLARYAPERLPAGDMP